MINRLTESEELFKTANFFSYYGSRMKTASRFCQLKFKEKLRLAETAVESGDVD